MAGPESGLVFAYYSLYVSVGKGNQEVFHEEYDGS